MKRRLFLILILLALALTLPWLVLRAANPFVSVETAKPAQAALIFGAVVRNGTISPLHQERLDAGIAAYRAGKADKLVVSNSASAARSMQTYLEQKGIPADAIEFDGKAERTNQTCFAEVQKDLNRSVIFVSQAFHLPRIALQCQQQGLHGQLLVPDRNARRNVDLWSKLRYRGARYIRENIWIWATILRLYPAPER